jgi:hypothetical protein
MNEASARAAVDAIVERDHLQLPTEEYERLVTIYAELQDQLSQLRSSDFQSSEPAVIFPAA